MNGSESTLLIHRSDSLSKMSQRLKFSPNYEISNSQLLVHQLTLQLLDEKALVFPHSKKED